MEFSDKIASLCFEKYEKLGKTGKPIKDKEWTLLSAIISDINGELNVVSLATGTKCIGVNSMLPDGTIVNDSHAEVLARRAFLRYLLNEIKQVKEGKESVVLVRTEGKYRVRSSVHWHFFSSRVPCGDASIIPMGEEVEPSVKRQKLDIHRTGAKPVSGEDPKRPGVEYHKRGEVRIKPGRGDPTASLSCSDKLARWVYTGIQGALLSYLIEGSIKFSSVVIGGGGPFNRSIIFDSLTKRSNAKEDLPEIFQASLMFNSSVEKVKDGKPAPASIIWSNVSEKPLEVAIEGRRQGSTSKNPLKGMLKICKRELLKTFLSLCPEDIQSLSYREIKDLALSYQASSKEFKENMGCWSKKPPGLENFYI